MKRLIRTDSGGISRRSVLLAPAAVAGAAAQGEKKSRSTEAWLPKLGENIGTDASSLRWLRQMGCQYIYAGVPDRRGDVPFALTTPSSATDDACVRVTTTSTNASG